MTRKPRTRENFPRMKMRGGTRRHDKRTPRGITGALNRLGRQMHEARTALNDLAAAFAQMTQLAVTIPNPNERNQ